MARAATRSARTRLLDHLEPRLLLAADFSIFNESYYLAHNSDVAAAVNAGQFPSGLAHFQSSGMLEGRSPSIYWDPQYYRATNLDVAAAVQAGTLKSEIQHFILAGDTEGRAPIPEFSPDYYLRNNTDVGTAIAADQFASAFDHFIQFGLAEGRRPSSTFDAAYYLAQNPDVDAAVPSASLPTPLAHFILAGETEGRRPSLAFDPAFYTASYGDIQGAINTGAARSAYFHFRVAGNKEGRFASATSYTVTETLDTAVSPGQLLHPVGSPDNGATLVFTDNTDTFIRAANGNVTTVTGFVAKAVSAAGIAGQIGNPAWFRAPNGTLTDIGNLSDGTAAPTDGTFVTSMNDAGAIVGGSLATVGSDHVLHPFLYTPGGGIQDLDLPAVTSPNGIYANADLVSTTGRIAGTVFDALTDVPLRSFVYTPGTGYKLLSGNYTWVAPTAADGQWLTQNSIVDSVASAGNTDVVIRLFPLPATHTAAGYAFEAATDVEGNTATGNTFKFAGTPTSRAYVSKAAGDGWDLNLLTTLSSNAGFTLYNAFQTFPDGSIIASAVNTNTNEARLFRLRPTVTD